MAEAPVSFVVDVEALSAVLQQLRSLRDDLAETTSVDIWADQSQTGDVEVSGAIDHFVDGWRDGRQRIDEKIDRCCQLLSHAIDTYVKANTAISDAAHGSSSGAQ